MSSFTKPLIVEFVGDNKWQLDGEFDYHVGTKESEQVIHIPAGFITDFASIPQVFWNILPPVGKYGKAAVVHDYLYQTQGLYGIFSRKRCDQIFLEAMGVLGVGRFTRWIIYSAVRSFGWMSW